MYQQVERIEGTRFSRVELTAQSTTEFEAMQRVWPADQASRHHWDKSTVIIEPAAAADGKSELHAEPVKEDGDGAPSPEAASTDTMPRTMKSITEQLRAAIVKAEKKGMSRYAIAKEAGVAQTVVHRCADGLTVPRLDIAERIAKAVGYQLTLLAQKLV